MTGPIWQNAFPKDFILREVSIQGCLLLIITAVYFGLKPFVRRIQPVMKASSFQFPFAEQEQVPALMATAIYLLLPLFNLGYFLLFLALFLALELTILLCELIKRTYGRLRPDFLSRCFGVQDSVTLMQISRSFTDDTPPDCSQSKYSASVIEDGRMSFPSEHSATASAVFMFMALWDFAQLKNLETGGAEQLVVPILVLLPSLTISVSRTSNYRHHATDVIFGILIGSLVTLGVFCTSFPRSRSKVLPFGMGPEPREVWTPLGDSQSLGHSHFLRDSEPRRPSETGTSPAGGDSRLVSPMRRR